ncbi:MAG: winged helix-turn-helix domain-containing protein [Dehalococcoidia bacterium]
MPDLARTLDGKAHRTFRLDMGPGSVDGWLGKVVADELGIPAEERYEAPFDPIAGELVVDGGRVALTPLELGVMRMLHGRDGRPVSRADLVDEVWGYGSGATSNVVEAVVLTLRRKLGRHAPQIETVRGVGYRYRA